MKNLKRYENFLNENFSSEETMMQMQRYYGYYDMSNSLDVKETAIPELEKYNIHFEYDDKANLLEITANENQVQIVHTILTEIASAPKSDGSKGEDKNDGAVVRPLNNY